MNIVESSRRVAGNGETLLLTPFDVTSDELPEVLAEFVGRVQCVYVDPPFMSCGTYTRTRPVGEKGWKTGSPSVSMKSYGDNFTPWEYYALMEKILRHAYNLLNDTGVVYLHLDWHGDYIGRIAMNRVFGSDNFVDEIIWSYETGGRTKNFFSHKHDTILMAKKGKKFNFDITRVPLEKNDKNVSSLSDKNHMRVDYDDEGRAWRSIKVGGKVYRYPADAPEYPTDVWSDISHLQQKDPERTGFITQKPLKLLMRMLKPVLDEGDIFCDLTCGSGTSVDAALQLGCRAIGCDISRQNLAVACHRVKCHDYTFNVPSVTEFMDNIQLIYELENTTFRMKGITDSRFENPLDSVESWSIGSIENGVFFERLRFRRTRKHPKLVEEVEISADDNAVDVVTAYGERICFKIGNRKSEIGNNSVPNKSPL